jgi:hypothetical protein
MGRSKPKPVTEKGNVMATTKMIISRHLLDSVMNLQKGKIFTIEFTKKDGTYRKLNCRKGVTSHLQGGQSPLRSGNYPHLRIVFDMQKGEYRTVNLDTATKLQAGGIEHIIVD